jgi:hypothetical protein
MCHGQMTPLNFRVPFVMKHQHHTVRMLTLSIRKLCNPHASISLIDVLTWVDMPIDGLMVVKVIVRIHQVGGLMLCYIVITAHCVGVCDR